MLMTDIVLLAAGAGTRLSKECPKQYIALGGVPMFIHSLRVFESVAWIGRKIIVHPFGMKDVTTESLELYGIDNYLLVEGGATRQASVRHGLEKVRTATVITHNAAVALVTRDLIEQLEGFEGDCATTAMSQKFNLARGQSRAREVVDKEGLFVIDSPQIFKTETLRECHRKAKEAEIHFNSDTGLLLHFGKEVSLLPGNSWNFKITTPIDLAFAEFLLNSEPAFSN